MNILSLNNYFYCPGYPFAVISPITDRECYITLYYFVTSQLTNSNETVKIKI